MLALDKKPIKNKKAVNRLIKDETIILGLESQIIYITNKTGSLIWKSINGKTTIAEIIEKIADEFSVTRKQAKRDVISFINRLIKHGLIKA